MLMAEEEKAQGLNRPCALIIVVAGIERFAFKGVASNMVIYLTDVMKMSNSSAAKIVNSWVGFTFMLPLLVATLANTYLNRCTTISAFSFLYVVGLLALTSTTIARSHNASNTSNSFSFMHWSLYMISIGQAGYNPSLQALGADQFENKNELDDRQSSCTKGDKCCSTKTLFFKWSYFGISSGILLGNSIMPYIQDTFGWNLGFSIPTIALVISIVIFWSGNKVYGYEKLEILNFKSFKGMVCFIKESVSRLRNGHRFTLPKKTDTIELELQERPLCSEDLQASEGLNTNIEDSRIHPLEMLKVVFPLLPIWITLLIFAVIFAQPQTFFTEQGTTMTRDIGKNFKIPPAALQSAISSSIILLMPFYDKLFIPLTRIITRNEKGITVMQRMGIGMFLAVIAMVIAAIVEAKRLEISLKTDDEIVNLNIFWLLPQYILLGISDIFTVVGMQEFFYGEVPVGMKTIGIALYTSVFGVGSYLSAISITIIEFYLGSRGKKSWFSDDMREARLDKYYWLLAFCCALSLLVYVVLCKLYKSRVRV